MRQRQVAKSDYKCKTRLKSGQVTSRQAIAKRLGRDEATVIRRFTKV